ncbi:phospholipase D-like domain-containing protein, partial [Pseudomonas sp. 2995-1]|uniref:phospholipase D-like domain-containing protein n=1 Tax=Pseudomonas sp. 2995-1 TaxID=1712679 RepID=UPI0021146A4E
PNVIAFSGYTNVREKVVDFSSSVLEYQGPDSVHAKTYIFDDRLSLIGSFNLDARSSFLSTETMVVIDSEEFAKTLTDEIETRYFSNSLV